MEGGTNLIAEKRKNIETTVNDGGACKRAKAESESTSPEVCNDYEDALRLLHLSDDVLLNIFSYCTPTDIRALSFCNRRLHILCSDRSLWKRVDLRDRRMGVKALSIYVQSLPRHTTQALCIRGLVGRSNICNYQNKLKKEKQNEDLNSNKSSAQTPSTSQTKKCAEPTSSFKDEISAGPSTSKLPELIKTDESSDIKKQSDNANENNESVACGEGEVISNTYNVVKESGNSSPKPFSPSYDTATSASSPPTSGSSAVKDSKESSSKNASSGKASEGDEDWTVTKDMMTLIKKKCPELKDLRLEFCYIDCNAVQSSSFPPTLETLSLKGSVCRNVPLSRAYLFRLHEHCPKLTDIDLSRCGWLASHSLLVLSKVPTLKRLSLKHCWGLGECVAYASLSARYGFKSLEVLDIRGTPMGDSEITAFSLIGPLKELLLQGSGVVEDSSVIGMVGGSSSISPLLRCRHDTGEPLPWEAQDPAHGDEWNWSSDSDDEQETEKPDEGAGGESQPNLGDPANPLAQMGEEGIDPFEAVGRVHVIYVDVRRAPHNNMLRVRYAPVQQPQQPDQNPEQPNEQEGPALQPDIEVQIEDEVRIEEHIEDHINDEANNEGNAFPEVVIQREGENRINFQVQYGNDVINVRPPPLFGGPPNPADHDAENRDNQNDRFPGRPQLVRGQFLHHVEVNDQLFDFARERNPQANRAADGPNVAPQPMNLGDRNERQDNEIPPNNPGAENRENPNARFPGRQPFLRGQFLQHVEEQLFDFARGRNPLANQHIANLAMNLRDRNERQGNEGPPNNPGPENQGPANNDNQEVDNENVQANRAAPLNREVNPNDPGQANAPRPLARPGEFLRRGPAFVLFPNDQQANRIMQQQQQAHVIHRREIVPQLLHDFKHTLRQLENYVSKLRTTERYDRYVRRIHFFRRMLQQIYTNEPVFNTNRVIPEQPLAAQRDLVRIKRLIETSCHHLERLISRAVQYPPDEIPFRINYNYIDYPDYVEENGENENDTRMRPETVEFYIQRYFGVPPAEEVNVDMRNAENPRPPNVQQQLNEPVLRIFDRNVAAAEEIVDIVNNLHNVLHERGENARNPNPEVINLGQGNQNAGEQQEPENNPQNQQPNARPNNAEEGGRMVNIRNINIEIREHNVHVPIIPAGEGNQRDQNIAAHRHIDEHIERMVHDEIRAMQQEHQQRRNRNDPRAPDERIRIEGPFVIRGDVMEEGGRRRRRVVHIPLQLNLRGAAQGNDLNYVGTSNLVTDASLLRFGVSKNIVHIGGDAQFQQQSATRGGQLTTLVCRGYPRVTDRALSHLAAAAPKLTRLDLSHTGVTRAGADTFRAARQDCELIVDHLQDNGDDE